MPENTHIIPSNTGPAAIRNAGKQLDALLSQFDTSMGCELLRVPLQQMLKDWFVAKGTPFELKQKAYPVNVLMLKGARKGLDAINAERTAPPGNDHPELWLWRRKPLLYVYHPYRVPSETELREFCGKYGLAYEISPASWYYLGRTVRVSIYDPSRYKEYRRPKIADTP